MNFLRIHASKLYPLLIIAVGFLAYCNTFQVPFVFDDDFSIVANPAIREFTSFSDMFVQKLGAPHRPVGYFTLALNYRLHGLDVTGYHILNLGVHLINALLVYALVRLTFRTPWLANCPEDGQRICDNVTALFAALIFVAHPVQTQAVTYIIQRLASLATLFYLLSLVSYVKVRLAQTRQPEGPVFGRAGWYLLSLLSAVMAMKTKEIAFTLPVMAVCYELIFFRGPVIRRLAGLLPLMLTMMIIPLTLMRGGGSPLTLINEVGEVTRVLTPVSRMDYLLTQFRVIVTYFRLLVFPVDQRLDYDYPVFHSLYSIEVFASFLLLAALAGCAAVLLVRARSGKAASQGRSRFISFCILWMFIAFSIESSIIPIADVIFEHRIYLPSVGFCMVAAFLAATYLPSRAGVSLLVCAVVLLGGATFKRNLVWGDEVRLWQDNLAKSPDKGRVYIQLGKAYRKSGRSDLTIETYNRLLAKEPRDPEAYNNRGNAYRDLGKIDLALADYNRAIALAPDFGLPYFNRAELAAGRKDFNSAVVDYLRAQELGPYLRELFSKLGYAYGELGMHDKAIEAYAQEIARNPGSGEAYYNRSIAYRRMGMPQESERDRKEARRLGIRR
jgi:Flp pilus assembly protein TadD